MMSTPGHYNCKSHNVIYLLTCGVCNIQYVGQTTQPFHKRVNNHRTNASNNGQTFLYKHFGEGGHDFSKATFQIIDSMEKNFNQFEFNQKENFWINTLCSIYPLGLNDKVKGVGNVSNYKSDNVSCYFNSPILRYKRGHGCKSSVGIAQSIADNSSTLDYQDIYNTLHDLFDINSYSCYVKLRSLKRDILKHIYKIASGLGDHFALIFKSYYINLTPKTNNTHVEREFIVMPFCCKFIDRLDMHSIFRDSSLEALLPSAMKDFLPLKLYYKYISPIGRKLFNYGSFLKDLNITKIQDIVNAECSCSTSPFLYPPHGHIITGDLNIIPNKHLRDLMAYGAKYREPSYMAPGNIKLSLNEYVDSFVTKMSRKYKDTMNCYKEWSAKVKEIISNRIDFFKVNCPRAFHVEESIFKRDDVQSVINSLHNKYIFVPADKAANNFVIVCKKYYVTVLMNELGIDFNTYACLGNVTYKPVQTDGNVIINKHINVLKDKFNIVCPEEDHCIPKLFWSAKLHKTPYKSRFIAGARNCTTKKLAIRINMGLKVIKEYFTRYCNTLYQNTGINANWSISSSTEFLDKLKCKEVWSMQVYDFSTLYTNLDLNEVKKSLFELFELLFSESNKYICIGLFKTKKSFFAKKKYNGYYCLDINEFKDAVEFILQNTYITFGGLVLQQAKGIPMGGNCSSQIADQFLCFREFLYMKSLLNQKKLGLARLLSDNSRYVDDLGIQNYRNFDHLIADIYPKDLIMERSGNDDKDVCYLDVRITIGSDGFATEVYNKVDEFTFPVVMFTFPSGNIPIQLGYDVFFGQIQRYAIICSRRSGFLYVSNKIFTTLCKRGYSRSRLIINFKKIFQRDPFILYKYGFPSVQQAEMELISFSSTVDVVSD